MEIVEYLFIDNRRLNSYIEQFRSPMTLDKAVLWRAGMGVAGPKADISQTASTRSLTDHEKIKLLLEYLEKTKQLDEGRNLDFQCRVPFRLEQCCAQRVFVPLRLNTVGSSKGLVLWISYGDSVAGLGTLTLLEDFPRSDSPDVMSLSAFSALSALFEELRKELHGTVLPRLEGWTLTNRDRYNCDPILFLKKVGCTVSPARWIKTLYRVRSAFLEVFSPAYGLPATFGYPIFISEADFRYRQRTLKYYKDRIGKFVVKFQRRVSSTYTPALESSSEWLAQIAENEAELEHELREEGIDPEEIL